MKKEDLIQKYFKEVLTPQEEKEFSSLLENDSDFKLEFEEYSNLQKAFKINEADELKDFLKNIEASEADIALPWYKKQYIYYVAAAVLVIGLCIPMLMKPSSSDLYNSYFEIYPNVEQPVVRGDNDNASNNVFQAYESNNFEKSSEGFKALLEKETNPNFRFYYAMSLLNSQKYDEALSELNVLESLEFDYIAETLWYSALISIKKEQFESAKSYLQILDNSNSSFKSKERKVLLKKL
ncbi:MAG: hypothetical protein HRU50_08105 [Winogradskyella sp.]|uniref:tetratricopeptide repeat protein n=1 Tax=Winogradskyella sp. TaxID=1883156 RepID=UPI0025F0B645|nr:hypothetical protein [Winogradskyella sp.]NRB59879.1 hypothetical protein [Winogradskyella sp.]